ncbi:MAG: gliding motility-associated C-terminal domain-containing protein [Chitinophagaceae bacterium]|nr:gliding motility-associated C-terminal domain-containing protein [Chitinophagaceae bacterium]MCW5914586.1 gliding motility-associated C-terminal domain-containing protein [Chitinophagaceae bacterium]MCZ2395308.1 gliding motility-associated C-terminal domain-containing protein [Chitinophagales bacterium]
MKRKFFTLALGFFTGTTTLFAQACTTLGQTPSTAFPVCGTTVFHQVNVPICSTNSLYVPGCTNSTNANYANKNPFWYRFTCFESGTLGFIITPNDLADDYDWQLYDITGVNPDDVFTNTNIIVTGNWAGNPGTTGATATGVPYIQCASAYNGNESRYAQMPNIIKGHTYILLVSHFTDTQSGYSLSFVGGSAVITDPKDPELSTATPDCDAQKLYVKLNKKMKCSSLAADGSDFRLNVPGYNITSAVGVNCSSSFDLDSLILTIDNPLPAGNYQLIIQNGGDGNTLLDNCDREIPENDSLPFTVLPLAPTPMDSLMAVQCAPDELYLVFRKPIKCTSIAPDGTDFRVTGPTGVTILSASGTCTNGLTNMITLKLSAPIVQGGTYTIALQMGSDGGTLEDMCAQITPPIYTIPFTLKDTVNANFNYTLNLGCDTDTVSFTHPGGNGITQWDWQLDYFGKSTQQNPTAYYTIFGEKTITLKVSNGFCSDSVTRKILLDNELKADFDMAPTICPEDSIVFKNTSIGKNLQFLWSFDNGFISTDANPAAQRYPMTGIETNYAVRLIASNGTCSDTLTQTLKVLNSCFIAVPNAFTPNNDGLNDNLYPLNAFKADNLDFKVYNRAGLLVFSSNKYDEKWDGTYKGEPQDAGVYIWTLKYTHRDTGKFFSLKGSSTLIR